MIREFPEMICLSAVVGMHCACVEYPLSGKALTMLLKIDLVSASETFRRKAEASGMSRREMGKKGVHTPVQ